MTWAVVDIHGEIVQLHRGQAGARGGAPYVWGSYCIRLIHSHNIGDPIRHNGRYELVEEEADLDDWELRAPLDFECQ